MGRQLSQFAAVAVAILSATTASAQIFSDDLNSNANWSIVQTPDALAVFGYDYSANGIPAAPRGSGTVGLKMEANNADGTPSIDHIIAVNSNAAYVGKYTVRVDMWLNWALVGGTVGAGTTEFAGVSIGHDGATPNTNGATLIYDGDGDSGNNDFRFYKNAALQTPASGQYATGTAANANDNTHPAYAAAFPSVSVATAAPTQGQTGNTANGAPGFQWITLNAEVDTASLGPSGANPNPGFARFTLYSHSSKKAIVVGTIDNSNVATTGVNMTGSIGLMASDIFNSITTNPTFDFIIFDNVKVYAGLVPIGGPGDFDNDADVDGADMLKWQRSETPGQGSAADFSDWQANYGAVGVASQTAASGAVPEPTAALLMGVAALAIRSRRVKSLRRRR